MQRIYHPYWNWEDYQSGMWRSVSGKERDLFLQRAIDFTGNAELYGSFMLRVISEWPISCEHNLTDLNQNRKAWLGHAACCLAINCPEDITRAAWHTLNQIQQDEANLKADQAIKLWEEQHAKKNKNVCEQMEITGLSLWNP